MPVTLSQVGNTQTFGVWLERTNQALNVLSTNVVTTGIGSTGAVTTGNGFVNGTFGSVIFVANTMRGGNSTVAATAAFVSNVTVNTVITVGNTTSNVTIGYTGSNSIVDIISTTSGRVQAAVQNKSSGASARAGFVAESDVATGTTNQLEVGITSSGYNNTSFTVVGPLDGYVLSTNGALAVGTGSAEPFVVYTGGKLAANERVRVDATGNVGIGNTNPDAKLAVTGTANISGAVRLGSSLVVTTTLQSGNATYSGYANIATHLFVGANATITGSITGSNSISISGPATFSNTIGVTGAANIGSTLGVVGAVTLSNTIGVTGAATFSNTINVTGAATFSNTISVTRAATFSNTISVTRAATFSNTISITGAANIGSTLGVTGAITGNSTLAIVGSALIGSSANVTSDLRVGGDLIVAGNLSFSAISAGDIVPSSNSYTLGNTTNRWIVYGASGAFANAVVVNGNSSIGGTLAVTGAVTLSNTVNVTGAVTLSNTVNVTGAVTLSNTATVTGKLDVANTITSTGNVVVSNYVSINSMSFTSTKSVGLTNTDVQTADYFAAASFRSAEYTIQIGDGATNYQMTKILVIHNGITAWATEFGTLVANATMASFAADINAGNVRLRATPVVVPSTLKIHRITLVD